MIGTDLRNFLDDPANRSSQAIRQLSKTRLTACWSRIRTRNPSGPETWHREGQECLHLVYDFLLKSGVETTDQLKKRQFNSLGHQEPVVLFIISLNLYFVSLFDIPFVAQCGPLVLEANGPQNNVRDAHTRTTGSCFPCVGGHYC